MVFALGAAAFAGLMLAEVAVEGTDDWADLALDAAEHLLLVATACAAAVLALRFRSNDDR